jgi:hypothetical protein
MSSNLKNFNVKSGLSVGPQFIDVIDANGNATFNTLTVNTSSATGFFVFPSYSTTEIRAITGQVGWTAAVSDSTPGGKHAYWDTLNSRWSYVSDDSAV